MPSPLHVSLSHRWRQSQRVPAPATGFGAILGPNLLLEFDARYGSSAGSWTDRQQGLIASTRGVSVPAYAVDGSFFNGLPVHQTAGIAQLRLPAPTPATWNTGDTPYFFWVGRIQSRGGSPEVIVRWETAGGTVCFQAYVSGAGGVGEIGASANSSAGLAIPDSDVHAVEVWTSDTCYVAVDGIDTKGTGPPTLASPSQDLFFGSIANGQYAGTNAHALLLCCRQVPTAAQRAQLFALSNTIWGTKPNPPLPASTFDYWIGDAGASATQAIGQKAGTVLAGQNTPSLAVDGAYFNGHKVFQSVKSGNRTWYAGGLPTVFASGTRPWIYAVGRWRSLAINDALTGMGVSGSQNIACFTLGSAGNKICVTTGNGTWSLPGGGPAADTLPHRLKTWTSATDGLAYLDADGTIYTASNGQALNFNVNSLGIGCAGFSALASPADASVAFYLVCSSKPTSAEETALDNWAKSYYGLP